jgi:ABC-type phosphate/phosphonate transport system substrate-binding protein
MAWRLLIQNGLDPREDTKFLEGKTHDNVVLAVRDGKADVGTVRTDTLERMQDEGQIRLGDFRIINPIKDAFPFVRSTELYPEWPIASFPHTDPEVAKKIAKKLMLMTAENAAAKAAKVIGWTYPADYGKVAECLQEIGYGAFAKK